MTLSPPVAGVWWAHTLDCLYDALSPPVAGVWWAHTLDCLYISLFSPPVAGVWWAHTLDWLYDSHSFPPVAGVWWAHTLDCLYVSLSSPPVAGVWWEHTLDCLYVSLSSPPVAGVWWAHTLDCLYDSLSSLSGVQARRPPSHRQRAPPPFLLDSSTSLHTPVYPHITPSWSQSVNYLYTSPPSLCLARLPYPHSLVYVFVVFCVGYCTDYIRFRAFGTPALRCRLGCPVPDYCFVFACWLLI